MGVPDRRTVRRETSGVRALAAPIAPNRARTFSRGFTVDIDRTLIRPGRGASETARAALRKARTLGYRVVLVSGRVYPWLRALADDLGEVEGIVAENGAVIHAPLTGPRIAIGRKIGRAARLRLGTDADLIVEYGDVIASLPLSDRPRVKQLLSDLPVTLIPNVDRLMVLPSGVTKATGARIALRRLGLGSRPFAAIGDAENDVDILRAAGLSGAVGNADFVLRSIAQYVCRARYDHGVMEFVRGPLTEWQGHPEGSTPINRTRSRVDRDAPASGVRPVRRARGPKRLIGEPSERVQGPR